MAKKNTNAKFSDIAATLGELSKKVTSWKEERTAMTRELRRLAEVLNSLLRELGEAGPTLLAAPGPRRGGRPRGYRTSAATRAKLRAAWRRRKERAAGGGKPAGKSVKAKRTMSAEARERIAEAQRKRWAAARAGK